MQNLASFGIPIPVLPNESATQADFQKWLLELRDFIEQDKHAIESDNILGYQKRESLLAFWSIYKRVTHNPDILERIPRSVFTAVFNHLAKYIDSQQLAFDMIGSVIRDLNAAGYSLTDQDCNLINNLHFRIGLLENPTQMIEQSKSWERSKSNVLIYFYNTLDVFASLGRFKQAELIISHLTLNFEFNTEMVHRIINAHKKLGKLEEALKIHRLAVMKKVNMHQATLDLILSSIECSCNANIEQRGRNRSKEVCKFKGLPNRDAIREFIMMLDCDSCSMHLQERLMRICTIYGLVDEATKIWNSVTSRVDEKFLPLSPQIDLKFSPEIETYDVQIQTPFGKTPLTFVKSLAAFSNPPKTFKSDYLKLLLSRNHFRRAESILLKFFVKNIEGAGALSVRNSNDHELKRYGIVPEKIRWRNSFYYHSNVLEELLKSGIRNNLVARDYADSLRFRGLRLKTPPHLGVPGRIYPSHVNKKAPTALSTLRKLSRHTPK